MYKAIVFDFFGVIHSDPANRWMKRNKIERVGEYSCVFRDVDHGNITMDQAFERLSDLSGQPVSDIKAVFGQTDMIDHEVIEQIKHLKKSYKIGLLSNAISDYLQEILISADIEDLFDEVVISGDVGIIKPDPRIYSLMLNNLSLLAEEVIFIDDVMRNVDAANDIGIKGVLFENSDKLKSDLESLGLNLND